eukprot:2188328-Heterocapsa_arctica.AAC.1
MLDFIAASPKDATTTEDEAIETCTGLIDAKKKEIATLTATAESKTTQIGELDLAAVTMKEDLDDTAKFRSEEPASLADTIKILIDVDALYLFKKALPSASASMLQVTECSSFVRERASNDIRAVMKDMSKKDRAGFELIVLPLSGKKTPNTGSFDKVIKLVCHNALCTSDPK